MFHKIKSVLPLSDFILRVQFSEGVTKLYDIKAIAYGKLINGVDFSKYGKQWVISIAAMEREYGKATK